MNYHTSKVDTHVYMYLEYRSRTESRILRACFKAYVIEDLVVPIVIGKNAPIETLACQAQSPEQKHIAEMLCHNLVLFNRTIDIYCPSQSY